MEAGSSRKNAFLVAWEWGRNPNDPVSCQRCAQSPLFGGELGFQDKYLFSDTPGVWSSDAKKLPVKIGVFLQPTHETWFIFLGTLCGLIPWKGTPKRTEAFVFLMILFLVGAGKTCIATCRSEEGRP